MKTSRNVFQKVLGKNEKFQKISQGNGINKIASNYVLQEVLIFKNKFMTLPQLIERL